MICPKCGHEMPEGHLLCEKCGAEINIVPDFDIEVENTINLALNEIKQEISPEESPEEVSNLKTKEEELEEAFFEGSILASVKLSRKKIMLILLACLFALAAVLVSGIIIYRSFSVSYQLKQVDRYIKRNNYSTAYDYINKVRELKPNAPELGLKEASLLVYMGDFDAAKGILLDAVENKNLEYPMKEAYFSALIDIFKLEQNYELINNLLIASEDEEIIRSFGRYTALPPVFSIETGHYDDSQSLEIAASYSENGRIMYTVDGTEPSSENGIKYFGPIEMPGGEYDIRAVYVNEFDVCSTIVGNYYLVAVEKPEDPVVEPSSGEYNRPISIVVEVPEDVTVYYTLDGTDPDTEMSPIYEGPVEVPFGNYNYSFVACSKDGILSEVVRRSYNVKLDMSISPEAAKQSIVNSLLRQGIIKADLAAANGDGVYSFHYEQPIAISDSYYFKFVEFLTDRQGNTNPTGLLYAVDCGTGLAYRLLIEADGSWSLVSLNNT